MRETKKVQIMTPAALPGQGTTPHRNMAPQGLQPSLHPDRQTEKYKTTLDEDKVRLHRSVKLGLAHASAPETPLDKPICEDSVPRACPRSRCSWKRGPLKLGAAFQVAHDLLLPTLAGLLETMRRVRNTTQGRRGSNKRQEEYPARRQITESMPFRAHSQERCPMWSQCKPACTNNCACLIQLNQSMLITRGRSHMS